MTAQLRVSAPVQRHVLVVRTGDRQCMGLPPPLQPDVLSEEHLQLLVHCSSSDAARMSSTHYVTALKPPDLRLH